MPAGVVKPGTEDKWNAAKKAARGQLKGNTPRYWALVNYIYGKMTHRDKAGARMESADSGFDTKKKESGPASVGDANRWLSETEQERLTSKESMASYAYTDSDGKGHLPIGDAAHVRNALARFGQTFFESLAKARAAWGHIQGAAKRFGIKSDASMPTPKIKEPSPGYKKKAASRFTASVAAFSVAITGDDPPEWIEVLPAGHFTAVDGRGPFENEEPELVVAASNAKMPSVGLVLDYDHSTDLAAPEGRPSPAAGWIKQFAVKAGAIMARIEWTTHAAELLKQKAYRYISPVFEHDDDGKVERILRAALTNNPALIELPALASARSKMAKHDDEMSLHDKAAHFEAMFPRNEEEDMGAYHKRLMRKMEAAHEDDDDEMHAEPDGDEAPNPPGSMPSQSYDSDQGMSYDEDMNAGGPDVSKPGAVPYKDEDEEEMAARHKEEMDACPPSMRDEMAKRHEEEASRMAARMAAKKAQGLEVEAGKKGKVEEKDDDDDEAMRARMSKRPARRQVQMTKAQIDQMVARHPMMLSLQAQFNKLRAKEAENAAIEKVDQAIRIGRLIPAQREWAIQYCTGDQKGFDIFIASQPRILEKGEDGTFKGIIGEPKPGPGVFSNKDRIILGNLGIESEEQITACAAGKEKWRLRFTRPALNMDDSNFFTKNRDLH